MLASAAEVELIYPEPENYYRLINGDHLLRQLEKHLSPTDKREIGNVACFRFAGIPHHVGLITDIGLIHASLIDRKVVEHCFDSIWEKRLVKIFDPFKEYQ